MDDQPQKLLQLWLQQALSGDHWQWLSQRMAEVRCRDSQREFDIAFGLIPRRLGNNDLKLDATQLATAAQACAGWDPSDWTIDSSARALLLMVMADKNIKASKKSKHTTDVTDVKKFGQLFSDLCRTADLSESIALYRSTALLPQSDALDAQMGEGLRTNIQAIFEAIAHRNPYPCKHFDQNRWNHMVLKALIIDSTLQPIQGLDKRANAELATTLCNYAHERWSAKRSVSPELWRCVGPYADDDMLEDLRRASQTDNNIEQQAALLAVSQCTTSGASEILSSHPRHAASIASGALTWDSLAQSTEQ